MTGLNGLRSLSSLFKQPNKINEYGVAARKYAEENLDLNIICKEYYDFIIKDSISTLSEKVLKTIKIEENKKLFTFTTFKNHVH